MVVMMELLLPFLIVLAVCFVVTLAVAIIMELLLPTPPNPPAWSFLSYDRYLLVDGDGVRTYSDGRMTLESFIEEIDKLAIVVTRTTRDTDSGFLFLPGEKKKKATYTLATKYAKRVFSSLIKKVQKARAVRVCFKKIGLEHLRLSARGGVRLRGVEVIEGLDDNALKVGLRRNLAEIADIIDAIFGNSPPADIKHLTSLLRNKDEKDEKQSSSLLRNKDEKELKGLSWYHLHASLLQLPLYSELFKELHETIRFKVSKGVLRDVLLAVNASGDACGWRTKVRSNQLLEINLNHRLGHQYRVPYNYPNQVELYEEQHQGLIELGIDGCDEHHQAILTPDQLSMLNVLRLFDSLRNRNAHRMEPEISYSWMQWREMNQQQDFNSQGSELSSKVRFPLVLCVAQYVLHKHGLLNQHM